MYSVCLQILRNFIRRRDNIFAAIPNPRCYANFPDCAELFCVYIIMLYIYSYTVIYIYTFLPLAAHFADASLNVIYTDTHICMFVCATAVWLTQIHNEWMSPAHNARTACNMILFESRGCMRVNDYNTTHAPDSN